MKRFALILFIFSGAAQAEDAPGGLIERGAQMFLEGLLREMEPALEDLQDLGDRLTPALRGFVAEMGPALTDLIDQVEDWSAYHPPEILENGDIILRKKVAVPRQDDVEI